MIVRNAATGNPTVNTGAGWQEFSSRANADAASTMITALGSASENVFAGLAAEQSGASQTPSMSTAGTADSPGRSSGASGAGEGGPSAQGSATSGGSNDGRPRFPPNESPRLLQSALVAAALLNNEAPNAISTDGGGNPFGLPGGGCAECSGSRVAQLAYVAAAALAVGGPAATLVSRGVRGAAAAGESQLESQVGRYLYHYTSENAAAEIESSALGQAGRTLYLTPSGGLSPTQAGIELALPQTNTASAVFQVPTAALEAAQVVRTGSVTGTCWEEAGAGSKCCTEAKFR